MSRASLIWIIIAVVALTAFGWFFVMMPARAEREWKASCAALEAKGEKLSMGDFPRRKIRDEDNFYADPMWWELADREKVSRHSGFEYRPRLPMEKRQLGVFSRMLDRFETDVLKGEFPEVGQSLTPGRESIALATIGRRVAKIPEQRRRLAEHVLRSQPRFDPLIARLHELSLRPDASFPWRNRDTYCVSVDHAMALTSVGSWLEHRVVAMLELGEKQTAFRDTALLVRLMEIMQRDGLMFSFQTELYLSANLSNVIDRGIQLHAWTADELREFDRMLEKVDLPRGLAEVMRQERALVFDLVWPAYESGSDVWLLGMPPPMPGPLHWLYRNTWTYGDRMLYCGATQQDLEALDAVPQQGMNMKRFPNRLEEYVKTHSKEFATVSRPLSGMWLTLQWSVILKTARSQTWVNLTRVGIALELYRMEHGEYPKALDAVRSSFPNGMPLDLITMGLFSYRRNEDGSFSLWSVGWDGMNAGGRSEYRPELGDWVWGE